jgi:transformation/transcription domain-associated protein
VCPLCTALAIAGWLSWGIFCDRVYTLKKDLQWAEHAVVCYLQAIAHKSNRSRLMITRILYLLGMDDDRRPVGRVRWCPLPLPCPHCSFSMFLFPPLQAFAKYSEFVPPWIWLMWIPQLLTSLARLEGHTVKVRSSASRLIEVFASC